MPARVTLPCTCGQACGVHCGPVGERRGVPGLVFDTGCAVPASRRPFLRAASGCARLSGRVEAGPGARVSDFARGFGLRAFIRTRDGGSRRLRVRLCARRSGMRVKTDTDWLLPAPRCPFLRAASDGARLSGRGTVESDARVSVSARGAPMRGSVPRELRRRDGTPRVRARPS